MIHIEISGSAAAVKLNGDGQALVVVGRDSGQAFELIYLRDVIDGWNDSTGDWRRIAECNANYIEVEKRLWKAGVVYVGAIVGSVFVA